MITELSRFPQVDGGNSSFCCRDCSGTFELDLEDECPLDGGRPSRHREQCARRWKSLERVLVLAPSHSGRRPAHSLPEGQQQTAGALGAWWQGTGRGCPLTCVGQDGKEGRGWIMSSLEGWVKERGLYVDRADS